MSGRINFLTMKVLKNAITKSNVDYLPPRLE